MVVYTDVPQGFLTNLLYPSGGYAAASVSVPLACEQGVGREGVATC